MKTSFSGNLDEKQYTYWYYVLMKYLIWNFSAYSKSCNQEEKRVNIIEINNFAFEILSAAKKSKENTSLQLEKCICEIMLAVWMELATFIELFLSYILTDTHTHTHTHTHTP